MASDFVSRFAPNLALAPPQGGGSSGMNGPDQPYDSGGTPLPYLQNQGGPRQYFGTPAPQQSAPIGPHPIDNSGTPMPYMQNQGGPRQYFGTPGPDGLRGLTPPSVATPGPDGLRGRSGLDPEIPPTQNILGNGTGGGTRYEPGTPLRIPPFDPRAVEDRIVRGIQTGRIDPITPDRVVEGVQQQGPTLEDILSKFNFQLPDLFSGQKSTLNPRTGSNLIGNPNSLSAYPDFSTGDGLAEFNRRMNLNLGPQVRSQAAQSRLVRGGYTTNRVSFHTMGRAADIHPRDIGGLTGQAAVNEVRRRALAAGYDVDRMQFIWETGRGRHQGTGAHVHMEPSGSPSQYTIQ